MKRANYHTPPAGKQFGRWIVADTQTLYEVNNSAYWFCRCKCGNVSRWIKCTNLLRGLSRSCGCLKKEKTIKRLTKHGATHVGKKWPEYVIWAEMIQRCTNPKHPKYARYGGRGIKVAKEFKTFAGFIKHIGRRPDPNLVLDRENNDGHYKPGNVRWIDAHTSRMNQRRIK